MQDPVKKESRRLRNNAINSLNRTGPVKMAPTIADRVGQALGVGTGKNIMGEREHVAINKANIKKQIERSKKK